MKSPLTWVILAGMGAVAYYGVDFDRILGEAPPPEAKVAQAAETTAPSADPSIKPLTQSPGADAKPDETALRYFARQGDQRRLEAEITRLKALYPQWTPPANPLAVEPVGDPQLDAMWKLYADGKLAELRKAIADRRTADPAWQVPQDLADRVATAEARERLVNASGLKQYATVIRIAAEQPTLLTCDDVDVMWRLAEAFGRSEKVDRARDAYAYILDNCQKPEDRLATVQKALDVVPRATLDELIAKERKIADGKGEFDGVRDELARRAVAAGNGDATVTVAAADLERVRVLATDGGKASDALLLGWYHVTRKEAVEAERWFRRAREAENSATASQGLALALIDLDRPADAEAVLYEWRDTSAEVKAVYMAAVANMLAYNPPVPVAAEVLQRVVPVVADARDAAAAQQLGWYAYMLNQFQTADQWFSTALGWKPDDEPSAYGLALTRLTLGDLDAVRQIQRVWSAASSRIATVGEPQLEQRRLEARPLNVGNPAGAPAAAPVLPGRDGIAPLAFTGQPQGMVPVSAAPPPAAAAEQITAAVPRLAPQPAPAPTAAQPSPSVPAASRQMVRPDTEPRTTAASVQQRGCRATLDPAVLAPDAALSRGWCLMEANRPLEAAPAFEIALRSSSPKSREEAAYGQSLAYLRAGLHDEAAVASTKSPMNRQRSLEVRTALLAMQATNSFEAKRYNETILALDERATIAPERLDLMTLRGYAYLGLSRFDEAEKVFRAVAAAGSRDGVKGLGAIAASRDSSR